MANNDPRLQWRQLNQSQPNVSGLMAQVRGGINDAAGAAESILGRYQEGQELKSENELIRRIGGMDQDQLRSAFNSGSFDDLNLGANGVDILNGAMGQRADVRSTNVSTDRTQASIGWGNDANSRANSAEGRNATRFGWEGEDRADNHARRDWKRDNADLYVNSEEEAFRNGHSMFSNHIDRTESGGGSDQYDTLYGHRNRQNGVQVSKMTLGQAKDYSAAEGDYGNSVKNELGYLATPMGKFQIVGTTLRRVQKNLNLPDDVPFSPAVQEQIGLYLAQQRVQGPLTRESMRSNLKSEWEGFKNLSDQELDQVIDEVRSQPAVTRDSIMAAGATGSPQQQGSSNFGNFQPTAIDRGGSEYALAMARSGLFTGNESLGAIDPIRQAAIAGQEVRDQQLTDFQNDVLAGAVESVVASPEVLDGAEAEAMIRDLLKEQGDFSSSEIDKYSRRGAELISSSESLSKEVAGGQLAATTQGAIEESAANTIAAGQRQLQGQDQYRALNDIGRFSEDPTGNLESDLGIPEDPETRGDYRSEYLRRHINTLADKYKVEPSVMAVAMRDAFIPDPGESQESPWWTIDIKTNRIGNRFDEDIISQTIQQLTPERQTEFARQQSNQTIRTNQLNQNSQQQIQVERRLQKAIQQGDTSTAERMQERLQSLKDQAAAISTEEILESTK